MDEWVYGYLGTQIHKYVDVRLDAWLDEWMEWWMGRCLNGGRKK